MTTDEIDCGLTTRSLGHPLILLDSVDSTNEYSKRLTAAQDGTVVIANHQTGGKGRVGRHWFSPPDSNAYISIILAPELPFSEIVKLPLVTGIALFDTASSLIDRGTLDGLTLKWPNDLLFHNKKLAGILCESVTVAGALRVIVGVGINVNLSESGIPSELASVASSLAIISNLAFELPTVIATFLNNFETQYLQFMAESLDPIRWNDRSSLIGLSINLDNGTSIIQGVARGIDGTGALLVDTDTGPVRFFSGDVSLI